MQPKSDHDREFRCEVWLPQPPQVVFPFFADAGRHREIFGFRQGVLRQKFGEGDGRK